MGLFSSDEDLMAEQKTAARIPKGLALSPEQQRSELMEHMRELREHRRWRQLAFLLFVTPFLLAVLAVIAQIIAAKLLAANP
jgi:hypothetical protein